MRLTPPIGTKGRYTLSPPFETVPSLAYTNIAIRSFKDIEELGEDVFATYYEPMGLSDSIYQADARAGTLIITLDDGNGTFIYVPDSYIAAFPNMGDITYNHVVLSISMGALPSYVPLDNLKQQISTLVSDSIGVTNKVEEHIAPSRGVVTPEQHELAEIARTAAITMRSNDRALLLEERKKRIEIEEKYNVLFQFCIDKGLLG